MFRTFPWRWAPLLTLHPSTGADRALSTPRWGDLARGGGADNDGLGWDLVRDPTALADTGSHILHLFGQVLDFDGNPAADVTIEIWQADPDGRARYDGKTLETGGKPAFTGYGATRTNRFGGYRFRTILPAGDHCPPHIDARLSPPGGRLLATRLYLVDDPRNERDWHFAALGPSRQAAVLLDPVQRADGGWEAGFNFVI